MSPREVMGPSGPRARGLDEVGALRGIRLAGLTQCCLLPRVPPYTNLSAFSQDRLMFGRQ